MRSAVMITVVTIFCVVTHLRAGTLYWDADGTGASGDPPASGVGGTGTWNNSTNNWWNGTGYQTWVANDDAVFLGTGNNVPITVGETIQVRSIIASEDIAISSDTVTDILDFSAAPGSFTRDSSQNVGFGVVVKATSGFTFDSTAPLPNNNSIGMGGTANVNEYSGTLNINTRIAIFRNNALGGSVGTAAHLNMDDNGIIEFSSNGNEGTFASMTGSGGSRILRAVASPASLTLTGAGLTGSDVRSFNGTIDTDSTGLMSIIKQGTYTQALGGSDKITAGIDIQAGGITFAGGTIVAATLTLGTSGVATLDGGTTRVETLTFSSPGGGVVDFTISGGVLALTNSWDATSLSAIADSSFAVDGVESMSLQFDAGTGDYSGYTLIRGVPPAGTVVSIQ